MHFYKKPQIVASVAISEFRGQKSLFHLRKQSFTQVAENESACKNTTCPTEDKLQNSNDYLRQIDCLGFAGSVAKRNAGCQDPAHCLSGFLSKAGSFLPGFIFSLFTCKRSLRLAPAFAPTESVRSRRYLDASLLKE